ncbi:MAG TPA: hypothetical protein VGK17_17250 [Propionicimonas sp.]
MSDEWDDELDDRFEDDYEAERYQVPCTNLIDGTSGGAQIVAKGVVPVVERVVIRSWETHMVGICGEVVAFFAPPPGVRVEPFSFGVTFDGIDANGKRRVGTDGSDRLTSLTQIDREYDVRSEAPATGFAGLHDLVVKVEATPFDQ